jgi:arsenate reductase-like glutaredoxin family protein
MIKKVVMYTNSGNPTCKETESFLRKQEIELRLHDIKTSPLDLYQVAGLLKNFNLDHFLDLNPKSFKNNGFDKSKSDRSTLIELIAGDNSLLRLPIIVSGRLMTVGTNEERIKTMLQINSNGNAPKGKKGSPS